jgi:hypothetical protein
VHIYTSIIRWKIFLPTYTVRKWKRKRENYISGSVKTLWIGIAEFRSSSLLLSLYRQNIAPEGTFCYSLEPPCNLLLGSFPLLLISGRQYLQQLFSCYWCHCPLRTTILCQLSLFRLCGSSKESRTLRHICTNTCSATLHMRACILHIIIQTSELCQRCRNPLLIIQNKDNSAGKLE